jgi:hypothetical protein
MKNTKHGLVFFIIFTLVGIAALLYAILEMPRSTYQEGLIYGVSSGFVLTGILGIIYNIYLIRNPKMAKLAEVQKNEERMQFIRMKSGSTTSIVMIYVECLATIILGLLGYMDISLALAGIMVVQTLVSLGFKIYYSSKY